MNKNSRKRGLDSSDQPKLLTSVAVVKRSQPVSDRYDAEETKREEHFSYSKPALQEVHKIPDVAQRNKRLFGNLISHLGKAKSNFETDTIVEQQNKLKDEVTKKNTEESLRISLLRKKKVMEERNQERKLRTIAILRNKKREISNRLIAYRKYIMSTSYFLATKAKPSLNWLPVVSDEEVTKSIEQRKTENLSLVQEKENEFNEELSKIDEEIRIIEEEKESSTASEGTNNLNEDNIVSSEHVSNNLDAEEDDVSDDDHEGENLLAALDGSRNKIKI